MKYKFPNTSNNEWIDKYNELIEDVTPYEKERLLILKDKYIPESMLKGPVDGPISAHHIIPRSLHPELTKVKDNIIYVTFSEHMNLHYYLWKADSKYASQLWFGCVYGRKHNLWDLPGGEDEYKILKRDVNEYRKRKKSQ